MTRIKRSDWTSLGMLFSARGCVTEKYVYSFILIVMCILLLLFHFCCLTSRLPSVDLLLVICCVRIKGKKIRLGGKTEKMQQEADTRGI